MLYPIPSVLQVRCEETVVWQAIEDLFLAEEFDHNEHLRILHAFRSYYDHIHIENDRAYRKEHNIR